MTLETVLRTIRPVIFFEKQPANPIKEEKRFLIFLFWEPAGFPAACNFRK